MMSSFEYPRLSRKEIIMLLAEARIASISEAELIRPRFDFVMDIYSKLLVYLDLFHGEDQGQLEFAALEQLENPERHFDSTRIMNLWNKIKEMLEAIRCPWKFTLKDLSKPDGDRTEFFVSSIVNYVLHKDTKVEQLKPTVEELSVLDEQVSELEERIVEINSEIGEYNELREKETPIIRELESQLQKLTQNISSLNHHQLTLKTSYLKMKEKAAEMDEKISSAEFALVQSSQEHANLQAKIVQSPDKLQKTLEDKKLKLADAKNAERSAWQSFQEKSAIFEVHAKAGKKMSKHLSRMQVLQEQLSSAKSTEKEVKALRIKLYDEKLLDKSLDAKLVERQGKVEQLDALRKQLLKERDVKCGDANKELNRLKMDIESWKHDLLTRQKKVEAVVAEVDAVTSKTNTVKETGASKLQQLLHRSEEIVKLFNEYLNSINSLMAK
uniref:Kinetochore protein Nuf2 N-terminal domain-containing protein n=1 Tax=Kalanchoe fedtschenkoi TaxID=63787 RepID=A0A7N0SWH5_KALFE